MSWTEIYPTLKESQVSDFQKDATDSENAVLEEWCGVARIINPQSGKHLVVASLFWKNAHKDQAELPEITRETLKNARELGLVTRFSPWEHYVQPLLDGAKALKVARPEVIFRVYLAADLDFLIEDLVDAGCEVVLMKGSSLRHNPGAMWRFLAFEEEERWVTITDSDRATQVVHDVERTERIIVAGLGLWRVPYIFDSARYGNDPGYYRPIMACHFGGLGGYPMQLLMRAFLWHTIRGTMPDRCVLTHKKNASKGIPIYGTDWPTYGFDEWFLIAVMYPRMAASGVMTFLSWNDSNANHWFALDIEYVTWSNPRSEIFHFGSSALMKKLELVKTAKRAESPILDRMVAEKKKEHATRLAFPFRPATAPLTLVVARYQENLRWLLKLPEGVKVVVYNKGEEILDPRVLGRIDKLVPLPNRGREADTYLYHLQNGEHGDDDGWTAFSQGDPFPHSPDFLALLDRRASWAEVQTLTSGYEITSEIPPRTARILEDTEWIDGIPIRSETYSAMTMDVWGWQDDGGRNIFTHYRQHHDLQPGWSVTGHFLESCGLVQLAKEAWKAGHGQFAYGAMFAVRNERLAMVPRRCILRMRKLACGHYSHLYAFERLWLHIFGLPFIPAMERSSAVGRLQKLDQRAEA